MNYNIKTLSTFEKEIKRLSKKYKSLKSEFYRLIEELERKPIQGVKITENCYKIRLSIASKGKGKSGGARIITYVHIEGTTVYLLTIYDKKEKESMSSKELINLLNQIT